MPCRAVRLVASYHEVLLSDGDRLSVLDSVPPGWFPRDPVAVLVHGLGGCARSPYVVRVADRLVRLGIRVVRMNLRGAGSGYCGARGVYHAGRTSDVRAVTDWLSASAPGSPLALLGFSLGANLVLKLSAESATEPVPCLDCVLAANPPLNLEACSEHIHKPINRLFEMSLVQNLIKSITRHHEANPEIGPPDLDGVRTLYGFDAIYTAPRHGFSDAKEYYARSSAGPWLEQISIDGLVIHAADDPFIPVESITSVRFPSQIELKLVAEGGHLGYISDQSDNLDRRWLEGQLAGWLAQRWKMLSAHRGLMVKKETEFSGSHTRGGTYSDASTSRE